MNLIRTVSEDEVYVAWLQSELYRVKNRLTQTTINIIENPNVKSDEENEKRKNMLFDDPFGRSAILGRIPSMIWKEGRVEAADIDKLYILPVFDWYLDTGKTFQLKEILANLKPNRGYFSSELKVPVHHYSQIEVMMKVPKNKLKGKIIIISTSENGPYTIIDGTHRAARLLKKNELFATECFLGTANDLSGCIWSVERKDFEAEKSKFNNLQQSGILW